MNNEEMHKYEFSEDIGHEDLSQKIKAKLSIKSPTAEDLEWSSDDENDQETASSEHGNNSSLKKLVNQSSSSVNAPVSAALVNNQS